MWECWIWECSMWEFQAHTQPGLGMAPTSLWSRGTARCCPQGQSRCGHGSGWGPGRSGGPEPLPGSAQGAGLAGMRKFHPPAAPRGARPWQRWHRRCPLPSRPCPFGVPSGPSPLGMVALGSLGCCGGWCCCFQPFPIPPGPVPSLGSAPVPGVSPRWDGRCPCSCCSSPALCPCSHDQGAAFGVPAGRLWGWIGSHCRFHPIIVSPSHCDHPVPVPIPIPL